MDLRGIQYDRGYSRMTVEDHQLDRLSIRAESSGLRSVAWTALYRFKLTSPHQQLTNLATRAVEEALDVADASDKVDLKKRSERARARIDEFISAAAGQLEAVVGHAEICSLAARHNQQIGGSPDPNR